MKQCQENSNNDDGDQDGDQDGSQDGSKDGGQDGDQDGSQDGQEKNHEDYDDCNKDAEEVEDVFDRRQITNRSNANWQFRPGYTKKKLNVFRE